MKMSTLDLYHLVKELKFLEGAFLDKIYDGIRLKLHKKEGNYDLMATPELLFLTEEEHKTETPSQFIRQLRKKLQRKKIIGINQLGFDRIVEFVFNDFRLVFEFFHNGNVILTDKQGTITDAKEFQKWKERTIKKGETYALPHALDITKKRQFYQALEDNKKAVTILVKNGFGKYGEYMLKEAGIDKNKMRLEPKEKEDLFKTVTKLLGKKPCPVVKGGEFYLFYENGEEFKTISRAIEHLYKQQKPKETETKAKKIKERQRQHISNIKQKLKEKEQMVERLNNHYPELYQMFETRNFNKKFVKGIDKKTGKISIELNGKIELDIKKGLEENRKIIYEQIKKLKNKIERAKKVKLDLEKPSGFEKEEKEEKWFHSFRYFYTSNGGLVVAGKDSRTNEQLLKKHCKPDDIVIHADIKGSPFALVCEKTEQGIKEAAEFVASYSKAWQAGAGAVDIYWVYRKQFTKSPPSGEYLPKGSFYVDGKRNYLKNTALGIAVSYEKGIVVEPVSTAKRKKRNFVEIQPGERARKELAEQVKKKLTIKIKKSERPKLRNIRLDAIQNKIPYGKGEVTP